MQLSAARSAIRVSKSSFLLLETGRLSNTSGMPSGNSMFLRRVNGSWNGPLPRPRKSTTIWGPMRNIRLAQTESQFGSVSKNVLPPQEIPRLSDSFSGRCSHPKCGSRIRCGTSCALLGALLPRLVAGFGFRGFSLLDLLLLLSPTRRDCTTRLMAFLADHTQPGLLGRLMG